MTRHMKAYRELHPANKERSRDVYVRVEGEDRFWYVGKSVASACSGEEAVAFQKRVILEHAKVLQPINIGKSKRLQLWAAPYGTEIQVAEHKQPLSSIDSVKVNQDAQAQSLLGPSVGFEPEQYQVHVCCI